METHRYGNSFKGNGKKFKIYEAEIYSCYLIEHNFASTT